jgi:hypothetical protein
MAAGTQMPPRLLAYWVHGEGAKKVQWGKDGDFDRCVVEVQKAVADGGNAPLPDRMVKGMCATMHKLATGATPGHAPGETMPGGKH